MNEQHALDRCGFVTASCFADVLAKGQGRTRAAYMRKVVAERLTGKPLETFSNRHTDRGTEQEPLAKLAYEVATGEPIINTGFLKHARLPRVGCSPDGLVGADGGVEAKSVIATVQLDCWETYRGEGYPPEHRPQIQGCMWVLGRKWWDFISYCPDYVGDEEHLSRYIFRVPRDEAFIATLEREVVAFDAEAERMVQRIRKMRLPLEDQLRASLKEPVPA